MANRGVVPIDGTTPVGQVRLLLGDTIFAPLVPPRGDEADFTYFSDLDIANALSAGAGSTLRATGYLVQQLALNAAQSGKSIKASDFSISTTGRGADLLAVAKSYFVEATAADLRDSGGDEESILIVGPTLRGTWL